MEETPKQKVAREFGEVLSLNDIIDDLLSVVAENLQPEDVFDSAQLELWAEENGYTKAD